jgi:DNA-binding protein HU-beta
MNKLELISKMAKKAKLRNSDVEEMLEYFIESISDALQKGDRVVIPKLGAFKILQRKSREARNPATGEKIKTKETRVVKFSPAKAFKEKVSSQDQ